MTIKKVLSERPLEGMRFIITRSVEESRKLSYKLRKLGAETKEVPSIAFTHPEDMKEVISSINRLKAYDWIIFTSVNAVHFFLEELQKTAIIVRFPDSVKIAAIGKKTALELEKRGYKVDFIPKRYLTEEIATRLPDVIGKHILYPKSNISSNLLGKKLCLRGAIVKEVIVYRTIIPSIREVDSINKFIENVDLVLFTSPSTVRNFVEILDVEDIKFKKSNVPVGCIGPVTAFEARNLGFEVEIIASEHTTEGLISKIVKNRN